MSVPPTGTVTFLFTNIEGSIRLWERSPSAIQKALARHDELLRSAIEERGGYVFKTVGDAFCAAFGSATASLEGWACSAAARGGAERAARLFGTVQILRQEVGYRLEPRERALREPYLASARCQLVEEAWGKAWAEGRTMDLDEAISYALEGAEEHT